MKTRSRSNLSGATMEHMIVCFLGEIGLKAIPRYRPGCLNLNGGELEMDVFLPLVPHYPDGLGIEVKWQQSRGSNYHKLPYSVCNIKECYPCPGLLVYSGPEFRTGAGKGMVDWCKTKTDDKLIQVFDTEEFYIWAMQMFA